jgi:hypothetical protein
MAMAMATATATATINHPGPVHFGILSNDRMRSKSRLEIIAQSDDPCSDCFDGARLVVGDIGAAVGALVGTRSMEVQEL